MSGPESQAFQRLLSEQGYGPRPTRAMSELMLELSAPLKKMKAEWLNQIAASCYKEEHLSDNFTNVDQIVLCKEETKNEIFGKFETMLHNHRQKDQTKLLNCLDDAGGDMEHAVNCLEQHLVNVRGSNNTMKQIFATDYKDYM